MSTGHYPRRTSGDLIVNHQESHVIMARSCLPTWYSPKSILHGTTEGGRRTYCARSVSLIWNFGESCTIVHSIIPQPVSVF